MKKKKKISKPKKFSMAMGIVERARMYSSVVEEQIAYVRWLRDINFRGNFKAQFSCATAIDILKGYYV